jgi:hypothetical protein
LFKKSTTNAVLASLYQDMGEEGKNIWGIKMGIFK